MGSESRWAGTRRHHDKRAAGAHGALRVAQDNKAYGKARGTSGAHHIGILGA